MHRAGRTRVKLFFDTNITQDTDENILCLLQARKRDLDQIQLVDLNPKVCH